MTDKEKDDYDYCAHCNVEPPALKFKCPECKHNPDKEQIIIDGALAVCVGEVPVKNIREELDSDIKKWMEELSKRYEYNSITT